MFAWSEGKTNPTPLGKNPRIIRPI